MTGATFLPVDINGLKKQSTRSDLSGAQKLRDKFTDVPFDFVIAPEVQPYRDVASVVSNMDAKKVEDLYEFYLDPSTGRGETMRAMQARIEKRWTQPAPTTLGDCIDLNGGLSIRSHGEELWRALNEQIIQVHSPSVVLVVGPRLTVATMTLAAVNERSGACVDTIRQIDFRRHDAVDLMFSKTGKVAGVHLESVMNVAA